MSSNRFIRKCLEGLLFSSILFSNGVSAVSNDDMKRKEIEERIKRVQENTCEIVAGSGVNREVSKGFILRDINGKRFLIATNHGTDNSEINGDYTKLNVCGGKVKLTGKGRRIVSKDLVALNIDSRSKPGGLLVSDVKLTEPNVGENLFFFRGDIRILGKHLGDFNSLNGGDGSTALFYASSLSAKPGDSGSPNLAEDGRISSISGIYPTYLTFSTDRRVTVSIHGKDILNLINGVDGEHTNVSFSGSNFPGPFFTIHNIEGKFGKNIREGQLGMTYTMQTSSYCSAKLGNEIYGVNDNYWEVSKPLGVEILNKNFFGNVSWRDIFNSLESRLSENCEFPVVLFKVLRTKINYELRMKVPHLPKGKIQYIN